MSETSERYRKLAAIFTERVQSVHPGRWDNPAPCDGWVARDVVRHMVDTVGYFFGRAGAPVPEGPSVEEDPVGAWESVRDATQAALDDPAIAGLKSETPMGTFTLEQLIGMFGVADVLIHTWDLSRATGQDETLDADEVQRVYEMMLPNDEMLRQGDAFGPKVDVPDDADLQTKLLAFTGRTP